jgi:hypothetical protein
VRGIIRGDILREVDERSDPFVIDPIDDRTASPLSGDVPTPFETSQMVADATLRHLQVRDNVADRSRRLEQVSKNA